MGVPCFEAKSKYNKRYKPIRKIGEGGQARVHLISDNQQAGKLKVLKEMTITQELLNKIISQSKYLTQLNHPNIVKATDYFTQMIDKNTIRFCIIIEYVAGGQLKHYLGKLTQHQIIKIYEQLKSALQYIHQKGIIHRDITLRNILLDQIKNVKLIDFGISSELYGLTKIITRPEEGTKYYFSPQLMKNDIVRIQTDLWQLGIVMIQLATGIEIKNLMKSENNEKINNPALDEEFPQRILIKYKVSERILKLIVPLLKKDYKQRKFYQEVAIVEKQQPQTKKYPIKIIKKTKINEIKLDNIEFKKIQQIPNPQMILDQIKQDHPLSQINKKQYRELHLNLKKINNHQLLQNITIHHQSNLIEMNCSNNLLTDDCAKIIISLTNLERLDISGNNLTDIFCNGINDMLSQFTRLSFAFTNITDQSLFMITKYGRSIQYLDISYTKVTSKNIVTLSQLKQLQSLAIWSASDYLSRYHEHIYLNRVLNHNKYYHNNIDITQDCIKQIQKLRLKQLTINLKQKNADQIINRMDLNSTCIEVIGKLSKQNIEKIVQMKQLERLYLQGVKDYTFKELKSRKLVSIGLVNSNIVIEELVNNLSNCEGLNDLNLVQNNIGQKGAEAIANRLTNLTTLSLGSNKIGDKGANAIADKLTNLTTLYLGFNNIGDQGATAISIGLTNLTTLYLGFNNIGDQGATEIANRLINLTTLYLGYNKIRDQGAIAIATGLTNLTTLSLDYNNIGQKGATAIAIGLTNLTTLNLVNNNIKDQGATAIATELINLTTLNLQWNNIKESTKNFIHERLKHIKLYI